jgi:hypothetical protein
MSELKLRPPKRLGKRKPTEAAGFFDCMAARLEEPDAKAGRHFAQNDRGLLVARWLEAPDRVLCLG